MRTSQLIAAAGAGAALAYMFDPGRGGARRAWMGDKMRRATRQTREGLDATARDMGNRARGIVAATRGRLSSESVDDATLVERVRAKLGRVCSHPRAIDVEARDGEVTLRGQILADEVSDLLAAAAAVRGVTAVIDELEPHGSSAGIPSLQGEGAPGEPGLDVLQRRWAPATRALVGAGVIASGALAAAYARRGTPITH